MKNVGLFGGSFNPIHRGHLENIRKALEIVDEVWIIPCGKHAFMKELVDAKDRIKMIKSSLKELGKEEKKRIKINSIELNKEGKSYTTETLRELMNRYQHKFYLIIGTDLLKDINKWKSYEELTKITEFIIIKRGGYKMINTGKMKIFKELKCETRRISSTEVRKRIKKGMFVKDLLPREIEEYIKKKGLYE